MNIYLILTFILIYLSSKCIGMRRNNRQDIDLNKPQQEQLGEAGHEIQGNDLPQHCEASSSNVDFSNLKTIYDVFEKINEDGDVKYRCIYCNKFVKSSGMTSNLWSHLRNCQNKESDEIQNAAKFV
uniref:BED-type domain-containing protein n=1 Tax=Meloidogyne hapla TaxID=6305 RepID=A0A1I8B4G6_MELHA